MIENKDGKVSIDGMNLSPGDVEMLRHMVKQGRPLTAFELMKLSGNTYTQYISSRLRMMVEVFRIVVRGPKRGTYEIIPEMRDDLKKALEAR